MSDEMKIEVPVNVGITAEQVNQALAKAVLESAIGRELKKIVDAKAEEFRRGSWNNPLENAVDEEMKRLVMQVMAQEFGPHIKQRLKELLTEKITDDFVSKLWEKALERY